jgi:hypothetical protein
MSFIPACILGALGAFAGCLCRRAAKARGHRLSIPLAVLSGLGLGFLEGLLYGFSRDAFVSLFLLFTLLLASAQDREEHRMEDAYWIAVLALGAGCMDAAGPSGFLLGSGLGLLVFLPALLTRHTSSSAGGADVKLSASLGGLLGIWILPGLLLSMLLALFHRGIRKRKRPEPGPEPFALVPYLSLGCGTVFLISRALSAFAGFRL